MPEGPVPEGSVKHVGSGWLRMGALVLLGACSGEQQAGPPLTTVDGGDPVAADSGGPMGPDSTVPGADSGEPNPTPGEGGTDPDCGGDPCPPDECEGGCGQHGACDQGACSCQVGYAGDVCDECATGWHRSSDGDTCTQSLCDPNPCAGGPGACSEADGSCCVSGCAAGATECMDGQVRECAAMDGCGAWGDWTACELGVCSDDGVLCAPATEVRIEQWGTSSGDAARGLTAGGPGEVFLVGTVGLGIDGESFAGASDILLASRHATAANNYSRLWGTQGLDLGYAAARLPSGDVFVTGAVGGDLDTGLAAPADAVVLQLLPSGQRGFSTQWGGAGSEYVLAIAASADHGVFVTGSTSGGIEQDSLGEEDAFVSRLSLTGELQWTAEFGTSREDSGTAVAVSASGAVFVTGYTYRDLDGDGTETEAAGGKDAFLVKLSGTGEVLWRRQWGTFGSDTTTGVVVDAQGDVLVVGGAGGDLGRTGTGGIFLGKWTTDGDELWIEQWGGSAIARDVELDSEGRVIVGGWASGPVDGQSHAGGRDAFVSIWTQSGSTTRERVSTQMFGTVEDDSAWGVAAGPDGAIYLGGGTAGAFPGHQSAGGDDFFIVRLEP